MDTLLLHLAGVSGIIIAVISFNIRLSKVIKQRKRAYLQILAGLLLLSIIALFAGIGWRALGNAWLSGTVAFVVFLFLLYANFREETKPSLSPGEKR